MKNKRNIFFVPLLIVSLAVCGCSRLPDLENHIIGDYLSPDATTFRTLYSSEASELNYLKTISTIDTAICSNTIEALVDYDQYGNIIPGLAESWESNEDMTEWTFHLRDDAKWVDYEGNFYAYVTADDFVCASQYVNNYANNSDSQYMYSTGSVVKNAQEYYDYTTYLLSPESFDAPVPEVKPEDIGVKAPDKRTVVYELDKPCPFFPSVLSYTSYLPICRKYLDEVGTMFAKDNTNILYNGAYILYYFKPLEKQVLVKNPTYFDADNVHIERIENRYDKDANSVSIERYMEGAIDKATVSPQKLTEYLKDETYADEIHPSRPDLSFSYFYAFNFYPQFDEEYEPENWEKAVVNENFRKAIISSINKTKIASIYEPFNPDSLINNVFTPKGAISLDGKDYTTFGALNKFNYEDSYSTITAQKYADTARKELEQAGVTFPIKIFMPYNPLIDGWTKEALLLEEMIENCLGKDFVDVFPVVGGDTGYLLPARRSGKYALMKCRWGADYEDPHTWTEPFMDDGEYMFWHLCKDSSVLSVRDEWASTVNIASNITDDLEKRFECYANAEALLLEHSIILPISIMPGEGYVMSKLNEFEGEYASYGMATQRYKHCKIHDDSMNIEEFKKEYTKWINH